MVNKKSGVFAIEGIGVIQNNFTGDKRKVVDEMVIDDEKCNVEAVKKSRITDGLVDNNDPTIVSEEVG